MTAFGSTWFEEVGETLEKRALAQKGSRIVVAVSGGLDSMVLLHVLHSLAARNQWKLLVAHFNHQLRGRASDADEKLVAKVAFELQLPMVQARGNVTELQKKLGISLEMAARKLRHEFLAETAIHFSNGFEEALPEKLQNSLMKADPSLNKLYPTVALAHHADDQSELFFLRLFRGAGGEGIAGMRWSNASPANSAVRLIRPLLNQTKSALLHYARQEGISYREDASNKQADILRNRIRHRLLPLLRQQFQPDLDLKIARLMETVGAEADYVRTEAQKWLDMKKQPPFGEIPVALQRQVIRLQLRSSGIEPDFECVEHLRTHPRQPVSIGRSLNFIRSSAGRVNVITPNALEFLPGQRRLDFSVQAGQVEMGDLRFEWQIFTGNALVKLKKNVLNGLEKRRKTIKDHRQVNKALVGTEYFDADAIGCCATLRHWRAGDRFQPIGMRQCVKIQDIMTNLKIPTTARRALVAAEAEDGRLFWMQGLRISEPFKIQPQTVRCLRWIWHPLETDEAGQP